MQAVMKTDHWQTGLSGENWELMGDTVSLNRNSSRVKANIKTPIPAINRELSSRQNPESNHGTRICVPSSLPSSYQTAVYLLTTCRPVCLIR